MTDLHAPPPPDALRDALQQQYEFGAAVGAGTSGVVYRATALAGAQAVRAGSIGAGDTVAIKVVRSAGDEDLGLEELRREGELGRSVDSPHVVTVHESGDLAEPAGHIVYLISEFVAGRTLRESLQESGPASGELVRRIGEQAAAGLAAVHEAGIVHRDIKPENLLITTDHAVRIVDLGLALRTEGGAAAESSAGFHGSLAYAAPEILRGQAATPQSDLYSLGVVLFELLTGEHPFAGAAASPDEMLHAHLQRRPPRPSHRNPTVGPFFDRLLITLLAKAPTARPDSAADLATILQTGEQSEWWRRLARREPTLASRARLRGLQRSRPTVLFGRDAERRTLEQALQSARAGRGRALVLRGAQGAGRRRLLDECLRDWLDRYDGLVFLGGQASDDPAARRGTPIPQMLVDQLLDGDDEHTPHAAERLAERLRALPANGTTSGTSGGTAGLHPADADRLAVAVCGDPAAAHAGSANEIAELLATALQQVVRSQRTTVLRIDFAESLGATGRRVLTRLCEACDELPLLLLLVAEPGTAPELPRIDALSELPIPGLDTADFVRFGHALFADEASTRGAAATNLPPHRFAPDEARLTALFTTAADTLSGRPGALLDSLSELVDTHRLAGRPGRYEGLAPSVRELHPARPALQRLTAGVRALPLDQRYVFAAAAVLGEVFELDDLAALTGRRELDILETLGTARDDAIHLADGVGRFRHRAHRRAVLQAEPSENLRRLHRAAAWVLEERGARKLVFGLHLSRAGEHMACLPPLLDALEEMLQSGARRNPPRLVKRIQRHVEALPRSPITDVLRLRWLVLAGRVHAAAEEDELATNSFREAIQLATELELPHRHAEALVGLAGIAQTRGRFLTGIQLFQQVEQLLAGDTHPNARATRTRALLVQARVYAYRGESRDALRLTREALRIAPEDDTSLRAHLSIDAARWETLQLRFPRALDDLEAAATLLESGGDVQARCRLALHRARARGFLGDREAADADFATAHRMARSLGDSRMRGRSRFYQSELDILAGDFDAALPLLRQAQRVSRSARDPVITDLASAYLHLAGAPRDAHDATATQFDVPIVAMTWALVHAVRPPSASEADADITTAPLATLEHALQLERTARVHALLRIALLRVAGRPEHAQRLIDHMLARLPAGSARRRAARYLGRIGRFS